jgi:hypothetical protein
MSTDPRQEALSPVGQVPLCDFISQASQHVRQMMQEGSMVHEILTRLATAGEVLAGPRAAVSILVLNKEGLLRN